jgi:peptidoglycan/LPS O-acetylase OafA/YrhL
VNDAGLDYRAGLTQLRALSVVLVLLFHAGIIDSGYIGVDVFFVLSGFLISSILWDKMASDRPTRQVLVQFYGRRCRRILPLSLLVLAVTAVASHFFFETLVDDWVAAGRAAAVWSENWFLIAKSNDYFSPEGTNPFQQYWSLAIEEQFYVVLPLLMALLLLVLRPLSDRAKLLALAAMAGAGVIAALASYSVLDLSVSEFYYSSFGRSYQLLTGVAVMALCRRFALRDDRRWLVALGAAGLVLAAVLELPVVWTGVLATGCAALCVLSSRAVLFESRWLERVGVWSYGIYLWHFPINAYLTNERLGTSPVTVFVATFAASTALAALTYTFFENPIRHLSVPNLTTFTTTAVVIIVIWVALGPLGTPGSPKVYAAGSGQSGERTPLQVADDGTVDLHPTAPSGRLATGDVKRLEGWIPSDETSINRCAVTDVGPSCVDLEGTPKVLLLGDSFANRIYQGLRPLAEEHDWGLGAFARPGCPWMQDVYNAVGDDISDRCARDKHLFEEVVSTVDPDIVVIHSYPYRAANHHMTRVSTGDTMTQEEVAAAADKTIDYLVDAGRTVVFVEPTPYAADDSNVDECLKVATWADQCDFEPIDVDSPLNQAMRARAAQDPKVYFASINDLFCTTQKCSPVLGDTAVMADSTHVSGGIWVKLREVLLLPIEEAIGSS